MSEVVLEIKLCWDCSGCVCSYVVAEPECADQRSGLGRGALGEHQLGSVEDSVGSRDNRGVHNCVQVAPW